MDYTGRGRSFAVFSSCGGDNSVHSCESVGGNFPDEANVVRRSEKVEILRTADLGIRENTVSEEEPSGSPAFAVIGPLVENAGHRGLPSLSSIAEGSHQRKTPRLEKSRRHPLRGMVADSGTLQRDTTQLVHLFHSHFLSLKILLPYFGPFYFRLI